jgi:hypothetical protein
MFHKKPAMLAGRRGNHKVEHQHDHIAPIFAKTVLLIRASTGARGPEQNSGHSSLFIP